MTPTILAPGRSRSTLRVYKDLRIQTFQLVVNEFESQAGARDRQGCDCRVQGKARPEIRQPRRRPSPCSFKSVPIWKCTSAGLAAPSRKASRYSAIAASLRFYFSKPMPGQDEAARRRGNPAQFFTAHRSSSWTLARSNSSSELAMKRSMPHSVSPNTAKAAESVRNILFIAYARPF